MRIPTMSYIRRSSGIGVTPRMTRCSRFRQPLAHTSRGLLLMAKYLIDRLSAYRLSLCNDLRGRNIHEYHDSASKRPLETREDVPCAVSGFLLALHVQVGTQLLRLCEVL